MCVRCAASDNRIVCKASRKFGSAENEAKSNSCVFVFIPIELRSFTGSLEAHVPMCHTFVCVRNKPFPLMFLVLLKFDLGLILCKQIYMYKNIYLFLYILM